MGEAPDTIGSSRPRGVPHTDATTDFADDGPLSEDVPGDITALVAERTVREVMTGIAMRRRTI